MTAHPSRCRSFGESALAASGTPPTVRSRSRALLDQPRHAHATLAMAGHPALLPTASTKSLRAVAKRSDITKPATAPAGGWHAQKRSEWAWPTVLRRPLNVASKSSHSVRHALPVVRACHRTRWCLALPDNAAVAPFGRSPQGTTVGSRSSAVDVKVFSDHHTPDIDTTRFFNVQSEADVAHHCWTRTSQQWHPSVTYSPKRQLVN